MTDDKRRAEFETAAAMHWELTRFVDTGAYIDPGTRREWVLWQAAFAAGERSMRERAAVAALAEGATKREDGRGDVSRWNACNNVAHEIRALKLSGE